jgi:hypothetical protein
VSTLTTNRPVPFNLVEPIPITSEACLYYIEQSAKTQLNVNLTMIAAGVLYVYSAVVLVAEKSEKKPRDEVQSALAGAFGETDSPNAHISRSKRYEFARLCVEISAHKEMRPLAIDAAKQKSIEAAVKYLSGQFADRANSVAALARAFGTERTSGRHRQPQEPVKRPFLFLLRALVERAEKDGQQIPFVDAVRVLAPAASQRDVFELIEQLIPQTTDDALPELIDLIERRRARNQRHPA